MQKSRNCTTHHHACDCREYLHAEEVKELKRQRDLYKKVCEFYASEDNWDAWDSDFNTIINDLDKISSPCTCDTEELCDDWKNTCNKIWTRASGGKLAREILKEIEDGK